MDKPNSLTGNLSNLPLVVCAEMALREAVREALQENVRLGMPAYIWRDGKVVAVPPAEISKHLARPEPPLLTLRNDIHGTSQSGSESK